MKNLKNAAGPAIRKLRYSKGLSQAQLAVYCQKIGWDVSRDIVARIENQTRWVADMELVVLAKVLSVPIPKLCGKPEDCIRILQRSVSK